MTLITLIVLLCVSLSSTAHLTPQRSTSYSSPDYPHQSSNYPRLARSGLDIEWTFNTSGYVKYPVSVYDIDDDGLLEVFAGSTSRRLYCFTSDGVEIWNFTVGKGIYTLEGVSTRPVVFDISKDGVPEVVFAAHDGFVYCVSGLSGTLVWKFEVGATSVRSSPAIISDSDSGVVRVVFGAENGIHCLDGKNGTPLWFQDEIGGTSSSPTVVDIDNDNELEVVVGCGPDYVFSLSLTSGNVEWSELLYGGNSGILSGPAVADVDKNGIYEVFVSNWAGYVYCLNGTTGAKIWSQFLDYIWSSPVVLDLDGDGQMEVVANGGHGDIACFNALNGTTIWSAQTEPSYSSPAIVDLNLDGRLEVVVGATWDQDGITCIDAITGVKKWTFSCDGSPFSSPVVTDIDNDLSQELLIGSGFNVLCLEMTATNPYAFPWPSRSEEGGVGTTGDWTSSDSDSLTDQYERFVGSDVSCSNSDADTLADDREFALSLHPLEDDTDRDGMDDGWELLYNLNPLNDDSDNDFDSDGLTNLEEYCLGTSPILLDSDFDNLSDYIEARELGTNPLLNDTDKDGYSDFLEYENGWNPLDPLSPSLQFVLTYPLGVIVVLLVSVVLYRTFVQKQLDSRNRLSAVTGMSRLPTRTITSQLRRKGIEGMVTQL